MCEISYSLNWLPQLAKMAKIYADEYFLCVGYALRLTLVYSLSDQEVYFLIRHANSLLRELLYL